jgi:Leucine-rich repeat (LRR) protein
MGKHLTQEFIIQRTKSDKFEAIKNLNLWGNDLDDISVINLLPNLEVLSLSVNHISGLKDFAGCPKLTELYLRKNAISDLSEVQHLMALKQLRVLWLWENPCADIPNYRLIVIKMLPQLNKLDNTAVTNEEREAARIINIENELNSAEPPEPSSNTPPQEPAKKKQEIIHQEISRDVEPERPISSSETKQHQIKRESEQERPIHSVSSEIKQHQVKREVDPERPIRPVNAEAKPHQIKKQVPVMKAEVENPPESKNENILCAVLALLKELDQKSLELVKRDIERKISSKKI